MLFSVFFIIVCVDESKVYTVYTKVKSFRLFFLIEKYFYLIACFLIYIVYTFVITMKHDAQILTKMPKKMLEKAQIHVYKTREKSGLSGLIRRLIAAEIGYKEKNNGE